MRQKNSLSLSIFVIIMDYLSRVLTKFYYEHVVKYHPKCRKIFLSHLLFTDDIMIFSHASLKFTQNLKLAMDLFSSNSGLFINMNKSEIFLFGIADSLSIQSALAISVGASPLGILVVLCWVLEFLLGIVLLWLKKFCICCILARLSIYLCVLPFAIDQICHFSVQAIGRLFSLCLKMSCRLLNLSVRSFYGLVLLIQERELWHGLWLLF